MGEIFYFEPKIIRFEDSARKSEETPCLTIILQSPRDWTSQWFELVFYFNLVKKKFIQIHTTISLPTQSILAYAFEYFPQNNRTKQ